MKWWTGKETDTPTRWFGPMLWIAPIKDLGCAHHDFDRSDWLPEEKLLFLLGETVRGRVICRCIQGYVISIAWGWGHTEWWRDLFSVRTTKRLPWLA